MVLPHGGGLRHSDSKPRRIRFLPRLLVGGLVVVLLLRSQLLQSQLNLVYKTAPGLPTEAPIQSIEIPDDGVVNKTEPGLPNEAPTEAPIRSIEIPDDGSDDFLVGKSCFRPPEGGELVCRDCGVPGEDGYFRRERWEDCPLAVSAGRCPLEIAKGADWDSPRIRRRSGFREGATEHAETNVLTHFEMWPGAPPHDEYHQDACGLDCWDLARCRDDAPIAVFAYGKHSIGYSHVRAAAARGWVRHAEDPADACLLLVTCDAFGSAEELTSLPSWNHGRNHFIFDSSNCFGSHEDLPFPNTWNYEKAAVAAISLTKGNLRQGFDVAIPLTFNQQSQDRSLVFAKEDVEGRFERFRPFLVSFRGAVMDWSMVYWLHRLVAFEYWDPLHQQKDVLVDIKCWEYQPSEVSYTDMLLGSSFSFCPGGGGASSYRLGEALALGSIPVVTPNHPDLFDLDWSGCWIRVSEARIADLPRLLRGISDEEIRTRRERCRVLFESTIGWLDSSKAPGSLEIDNSQETLLGRTLQLWDARIHSKIQLEDTKEKNMLDGKLNR